MSNLPVVSEIDVDDLEDLTPQRHEFVQGILAGKTQTQAYRDAYNVGEDTLASSVTCVASRLAAEVDIRSWLRLLRTQAMARGTVTLEGHLAELERLKEIGIATGNIGAATKAEELRGKAAGVYLGDGEGKLAKASAAQLIELIRQVLGEDVAEAAAKKLGIALLPRKMITIEHDEADSA